jgi:hypothetical protein
VLADCGRKILRIVANLSNEIKKRVPKSCEAIPLKNCIGKHDININKLFMTYTVMYNLEFMLLQFKGTAQRKLTGVKSGINQ